MGTDDGYVAVRGLVSPPTVHRPTGRDIYTFLNGRFIRDRLVNHAVIESFRSLVPRARFPVAVLWISIDPAEADVNVHPTKHEVRFQRPDQVHRALQGAITLALGRKAADSPAPGKRPGVTPLPQYTDTSRGFERPKGAKPFEATPAPVTPDREPVQPAPGAPAPHRAEPLWDDTGLSGLRLIGQLAGTYLLCEAGDGSGDMVVIDQHAAHERLNFERLKAGMQNDEPPRQLLLMPETVELSPGAARLVTEHLEHLAGIGLDIEPFGGQTFIVKAVPVVFEAINAAEVMTDLADLLAELGVRADRTVFYEKVLTFLACRSAIKAGQHLDPEQMQALIRDLAAEPAAYTCPHGRPVIWRTGLDEVGKKFKR